MPPRAKYQPPPPDPDPLLTTADVGRVLHVSKRTVQRWVRRRILPAPMRFSAQKLFWRTSTINRFVEAKRSLAAARQGREGAGHA
jgi:predicted DNA-binding transcriptional regulator AlpA